MPEKSLTIAAYAGAASLAAATLVYVFGPTFFLDEVDASNARNAKKRVAIGLNNPANDCYLNSTVQALAGLPSLRLYLIHELHQRQHDGKEVYQELGQLEDTKTGFEKRRPEWLQLSLQSGIITAALKEMLDALNERPLAKKTISAQPFITAVEQSFKTRVSRYQQDAQEFLQLVLERLADEHYAGVKARQRAHQKVKIEAEKSDGDAAASDTDLSLSDGNAHDDVSQPARETPRNNGSDQSITVDPSHLPTLPFEGKIQSQIECETCNFKPKPAETTFVTLTLNVPQQSGSTSLDACLDGMFKIEHIDDFRCDRCRLEYAFGLVTRKLQQTTINAGAADLLRSEQKQIQEAIEQDPEHPPKGLSLPDAKSSPKRRISRHMRIATFPKVLAIHLSRSVWDSYSSSSKNTAKVTYPEFLQLGSLLDRHTYRLLAVITHKGGHNSGHYETWRRQWLAPSAIHINHNSVDIGSIDSPLISARTEAEMDADQTKDTEPQDSVDSSSTSTLPSEPQPATNVTTSPRLKATSQAKLADRRRKAQDRWWRISDEKVKDCKLSDVLSMKSEVYMIFYELVL